MSKRENVKLRHPPFKFRTSFSAALCLLLGMAAACLTWNESQAHGTAQTDNHDSAAPIEGHASSMPNDFDEKTALAISQSVIGRPVNDQLLRGSDGRAVRLSDFQGRPVLVNFIYTSCVHSCGVMTESLADIYENAWDALGPDSFTAVTIGFDTAHDNSERMASFARQHGVHNIANWHFVGVDAPIVTALADSFGFQYFKSSKGFDHIDQVTLVDAGGLVQTQVYGERFDKPLVMEPLKALVFGTPSPFRSLDDLVKKIRLFCTLYDPAADRYRFDYSIFIRLGVGIFIIGGVSIWLAREMWSRRRRRRHHGPARSA